ncbi:hypothetical protein SAMN05444408_101462 [Chryseobacterium takakiae]|uniref:Uncharacterized protein n=1 Tax=Chryseobacterium takakiae TaxID=1302685 RepID=A0A1M4TMA5_9FLAO|nr:hypothetical protein SAMN05444408_101462 [Chryseobacterium takakiae]
MLIYLTILRFCNVPHIVEIPQVVDAIFVYLLRFSKILSTKYNYAKS